MQQYPMNQSGQPTVVVGFERPLNPQLDALTPWRRHDGEPARSGYPRLEVYDDRIRLHHTPARGEEWSRRDGDRVLHDAGGRHPCVYVGDNAGSGIDATEFDVDRVRAAVLAHGWFWEAGGVVFRPVESRLTAAYAPAEPEVELVLKQHRGRMNTAARARGPFAVAMVFVALAAGAAILAATYYLGPWSLLYIIGGLSVAVVVAAVVYVARYQGLAVTISRSRIVVRTGSDTTTVHRGQLVRPARVDKYGVTFKYGKALSDEVHVSTSNRREELLARLSGFDWPLEHR